MMTNPESASLASLTDQLANAASALPPVQDWQPENVGQIDIRIRRDASWWHEGSEIHRPELVRLFSSVLRLEDNQYWLVTPLEKLRIQVDDAPFVATSLEVHSDEKVGPLLVFNTNVGDRVLLGEKNRLHVEFDVNSGHPSPYIHVRNGLRALLTRSVYYELVELGRVQQDKLLVTSNGASFSLGSILDM